MRIHQMATALAILLATGATALAQDAGPEPESKPQHKHYREPAKADKPSPSGALAPRLQNLGKHTFPVSCESERAQLFINQGVNLAYGFNHAEAGRSFREAARLAPDCAMAYWGQALVLGPNINVPMDQEMEPKALELAQKAMSLRDSANKRERALIEALAKRYSGDPTDRRQRDQDYAAAMAKVAQQFPDDLDIATLYAESMMDLRPWNYWMRDGTPYEGTEQIVALLESVMSRNPKHPGALHLYIHLIEPTKDPERAEKAADALTGLMPGAGHIVHMPAHIYQRVGRYEDSAKANERAIAADEDYISQCRAQGIYPMAYYPHNIHFLWFATTAQGRGAAAIDAANKTAEQIGDEALKEMPMLAGFRVVPYWALARFGKWDEVLALPQPPDDPFLTGAWHYVRGLAYVGKGNLDAASGELEKLRKITASPALDYSMFSPNSAASILAIAPEVLAGELAAVKGDYDTAIAHLDRAVRMEDGLVYTEPAEWHYPPRLALGAVLLDAGRPGEAETVYWQALEHHPQSGWALFGLSRALREQHKTAEAELVDARFKQAWRNADVKLTASRIR
ncbi:tetratricopeptide repeat protein [uncultured Microbulbifer sp.]|uniref:tetratricopeptide repeat protein n=1 Tax=uncultured Microbulbifer sp. TaxID=348147 RepID=UPI0025CBD11A|nr:tetratricopeptide repeat protein [uncultured Microbulbifer sp.]